MITTQIGMNDTLSGRKPSHGPLMRVFLSVVGVAMVLSAFAIGFVAINPAQIGASAISFSFAVLMLLFGASFFMLGTERRR